MMSDSLIDDFHRYVCQTSPFSSAFPVARAEGCNLFDTNGRAYLDFIAGIAVNNVGHCHPEVVRAVQGQAAQYAHTMVYGEHAQAAQVELAREIAAIAPPGMDCTYFLTTGAEANDAALKMAVKLTGRRGVVAFHGAYHGDTLGALSCFGDIHFREPFGALLGPVAFLPFGDFDALDAVGEATACVLVEPVQGEAGIRVPPDGWLAALRARCTQAGAMLVFDEVQTGFGRVADWFAARRYGVTPDAITVAKGMGAGMPLAGVIGPRAAMNRFAADPPFSHITTFGGNPVCCAAGLAALRVIRREGLLARAEELGTRLRDGLRRVAEDVPEIVEVRGVGLMIGVETASREWARRVVLAARERGLIVETNLLAEHVIRISPPLTITAELCDDGLSRLADAARNAT